MSNSFKILCLSLVVSAAPFALNAKTWQISNEQSPLEVHDTSPLDLHIERLEYAESPERENIVIVDSNGKKSYGCLMYQRDTWERYTQKYGIQANIMDCAAQKTLTKHILAEKGGWKNWYNSHKKIGLPPLPPKG